MGLYAVDPKAEPPEFYVQPRIIARTREVTRAVVEIKTTVQPDEILVSVPPTATETQSGRAKITESDFIEQLSRSSSPEVVRFAKWVIEHAPAHGLTITWGDAGPLLKYEDDETGYKDRTPSGTEYEWIGTGVKKGESLDPLVKSTSLIASYCACLRRSGSHRSARERSRP